MQITKDKMLYSRLPKVKKVEDYVANFFNQDRGLITYDDIGFSGTYCKAGSRTIEDTYVLCRTTYEGLTFYKFIKAFKKAVKQNNIYGVYCHNINKIVWRKRENTKYADKRYRYLIKLTDYGLFNYDSFWYNSKRNIEKHGYSKNTLTREQIIKLFKKI
mgnify:FL=1|tara:strand:- start:81247 stop:81723 length:477 start_codon:yes stop_codon:yes gene_type:complete